MTQLLYGHGFYSGCLNLGDLLGIGGAVTSSFPSVDFGQSWVYGRWYLRGGRLYVTSRSVWPVWGSKGLLKWWY